MVQQNKKGYQFPKELNASITTPKGTARWPRVNTPDMRFDPKDEHGGTFKAEVVLSAADAQPLLDRIKTMQREALKAYKADNKKAPKVCDALPIKPEVDDEGNETGNFVFVAKLKGRGTKNGEQFNRSVVIFDAKRNKVTAQVGGGSTIRVSADLRPFYNAALGLGITSQLKAVQVIKLVEYTGGVSDGSEFDVEEDGYEGAPAVDEASADAEGLDDAPAGDDKDGL